MKKNESYCVLISSYAKMHITPLGIETQMLLVPSLLETWTSRKEPDQI